MHDKITQTGQDGTAQHYARQDVRDTKKIKKRRNSGSY